MKTTLIFIGPTGAGKDTQAKLLADQYGYTILNTGDHVRARMKTDAKLRADIERGLLASDQLVNDVVASVVDGLAPHDRLLSDGYPRRRPQAEWFDQFLAEAGREVNAVLYLRVDPAVSLERLHKRGRADDQTSLIQKRLELFDQETQPVLDYYQERGLLITINGDQSVEAVHRDIVEQIQ